jgi:hypothetical protein
MSYTSTSVLKRSATATQIKEMVDLLGYRRSRDTLKVPNRVAGYFWYEERDYRSWSGVELDIYTTPRGQVTVTTRSSVARSYWDLTHQNKTLKLLRDLFGGHFETDAGRNRYWRPDEPPPPPISSGCYLARWKFNKNFVKVNVYLMNRKLEGPIARNSTSGFEFLDEINPRLLSNNLLVPYMIAVWEEFFRATFAVCLRYSKQRETALKRAKLSHADLEQLALGSVQVERSVADFFSFQRPSAIAETFKLLDPKLDLAAPMRKPYRRRRVSLYESIEALVEQRNSLVHSGDINLLLFDKKLQIIMSDLTEAINRTYNHIAKHFGFPPNHNY